MLRGALVVGLGLGLLLAGAIPAGAAPLRPHRFAPGGRIQAVRIADVNADGRPDLVVLASDEGAQALLVLRTPAVPKPGAFFDTGDVLRIPLDAPPFAHAGALAIGRFGEGGAIRLRFFAPEGILELDGSGALLPPTDRHRVPTLLGRSPGRPVVFWDAVGDLDGDGLDECWFPLGAGPGVMRIFGGAATSDRTVDLAANNRGASDAAHPVRRIAYTPNLFPVDLEGDGTMELAAWRPPRLALFAPYASADAAPAAPRYVELPFVKEELEGDEVHTPRVLLEDVDGDGITDLLVTLVTGDRRKVESFRTRLLHYPGPFVDAKTGALVEPRARLDTVSVTLHPRFVDLDGDGALDYVSDAIRGTKTDLFKRVLFEEPTIWYVAFRFNREQGTYENTPWFRVERPYSREQAVNNTFGISAYFDGDFDGDGHADLLGLGNLTQLELLRGVRGGGRGGHEPVSFSEALLPRTKMPATLAPFAWTGDLDGDGKADVVLRSDEEFYLLVSGSAR